jgi:hypothetical protein
MDQPKDPIGEARVSDEQHLTEESVEGLNLESEPDEPCGQVAEQRELLEGASAEQNIERTECIVQPVSVHDEQGTKPSRRRSARLAREGNMPQHRPREEHVFALNEAIPGEGASPRNDPQSVKKALLGAIFDSNFESGPHLHYTEKYAEAFWKRYKQLMN